MSELDLSTLANLPRGDLIERWQRQFGGVPPKGISRRLMAGAIAYAVQAKQQGGPSAALQRRMAKLVGGAPVSEASAPWVLRPGARLVREWNGVTHTVEIVDGGCVWRGERYRSLSAVARAITGARWSGPRFFGIGS